MTIQEAINSKKMFKRKSWQNWYKIVQKSNPTVSCVNSNFEYCLTYDDILAEDWELKIDHVKIEYINTELLINGTDNSIYFYITEDHHEVLNNLPSNSKFKVTIESYD